MIRGKEAEVGDSTKSAADADAELRAALDQNLMELEKMNKQLELEQQELEEAIAMSLFIEQVLSL